MKLGEDASRSAWSSTESARGRPQNEDLRLGAFHGPCERWRQASITVAGYDCVEEGSDHCMSASTPETYDMALSLGRVQWSVLQAIAHVMAVRQLCQALVCVAFADQRGQMCISNE